MRAIGEKFVSKYHFPYDRTLTPMEHEKSGVEIMYHLQQSASEGNLAALLGLCD
jgi:hypothetical protein